MNKVPNFDMEGLKTFFMVVKCHSFSEAAEILHKTPATISYRIKALEDQIGMPLFKRSTRNVELLPAGEHLMEFATQIYGLLQEIPKNLQQLSLGAEPTFTVSINNLLYSPEGASELLGVLVERFPYTQFEIKRSVYMGVWDSLLSHEADLAIGVPTWHAISNDFTTFQLGEIHWAFAVAPNHPLAAKVDETITNADLLNYPAINVQDTSVNLHKRTAWLLNGQHEIVVPNMKTKLACHLKGIGVGFLPEPLIRPYVKAGQLVMLKVAQHRLPSPMAVAWRSESTGAVCAFVRELFETQSPVVDSFKQMLSA